MVYVPTTFAPGQQLKTSVTASAASSSSSPQRPQNFNTYGASAPSSMATVPGNQQQQYQHHQLQYQNGSRNNNSPVPPFSQSLNQPAVSQQQRPAVSASMPPFSQSLNQPTMSQQQQYQDQQLQYQTASMPPHQQNPVVIAGTPVYHQQQPTQPAVQAPQHHHHHHALASSAPAAMYGNNGNTASTVATTGLLTQQGHPVKCHKVDYEIKGNDCQLVEVQLDPSETVVAEAGAMMYMDNDIDFETKFGDGSNPSQGFFSKLMSAGGRILTGESVFLTHFTCKGQAPARVAFAAPYPGTILAIDMQQIGEKLICERDAFLCAALGTKVSVHFHKKFGAGLFGGEGFILQKLKGDGMAFVHAGGTIIKRELNGERLRVDTGCLVAFTEGINYDIQRVPGLKSMFFGGEGIFLATLQGTGTVWLQSLPFSRMCDRILANARSQGGTVGEGSHLTGQYGNYIDGDGVNGGLGALSGIASALGKM